MTFMSLPYPNTTAPPYHLISPWRGQGRPPMSRGHTDEGCTRLPSGSRAAGCEGNARSRLAAARSRHCRSFQPPPPDHLPQLRATLSAWRSELASQPARHGTPPSPRADLRSSTPGRRSSLPATATHRGRRGAKRACLAIRVLGSAHPSPVAALGYTRLPPARCARLRPSAS